MSIWCGGLADRQSTLLQARQTRDSWHGTSNRCNFNYFSDKRTTRQQVTKSKCWITTQREICQEQSWLMCHQSPPCPSWLLSGVSNQDTHTHTNTLSGESAAYVQVFSLLVWLLGDTEVIPLSISIVWWCVTREIQSFCEQRPQILWQSLSVLVTAAAV